MGELKAIIFDMDGTLADTEELHRRAFNLAFRECACPLHWSRLEYKQLLSISGGRERIYHCLQQAGVAGAELQRTVDAVHQTKSTLYRQILVSDVIGLRPGIRRLVQECRAAGLKLAIATSSSTGNVNTLLNRTFGSAGNDFFPVVVTCDVVAEKKPSPAVYVRALSELGLKAEHCLAVEDTSNGNRAALAAGIHTVITTHPLTVDDDFSGASLVLNHLGEPDKPFKVAAGAAYGRHFVDLDLLRTINGAGDAAEPYPPRRARAAV